MYVLAEHQHTIRDAFRFREDLQQKAANFLEKVQERRRLRDITFIGFHIRRTDYTRFIKVHLMPDDGSRLGPSFVLSFQTMVLFSENLDVYSARTCYDAVLQNKVLVEYPVSIQS